MAFSMKIHGKDTPREVIAVCDDYLVGKVLEDKNREIEFTVSSDFYGNEKFEWTDISQIVGNGRNLNLLGNEIVEQSIKAGVIDPENVIEISGIKHAQLYFV
ncbi:MAG: DUF424 family protein [Candidatus Parvarchaeota archaeon]|jgi:hypothetical protein|nr:DUF424 family protein [Candidatus Parvarchaeota archaeon]MCL5420507.1 DUF424 family protein [Candidatus Parvarchaeota archaeon]